MSSCQARQVSDQRHCAACGLTWDTNDPEPPRCLTEAQQRARRVAIARDRAMTEIRRILYHDT